VSLESIKMASTADHNRGLHHALIRGTSGQEWEAISWLGEGNAIPPAISQPKNTSRSAQHNRWESKKNKFTLV
jgi:hypothetical protein